MNKQLLSSLQNNYKKLYYVVNHIFSIKDLMGENYNKGVYCPFHGESRSSGSKPSARFYENQFPVKLWCFTEHRSYYAYHYIKLIMKEDPLKYLISKASDKKIAYYIEEYEDQAEEENEITYQIKSLSDVSDLYTPLPLNVDYSKWYIV